MKEHEGQVAHFQLSKREVEQLQQRKEYALLQKKRWEKEVGQIELNLRENKLLEDRLQRLLHPDVIKEPEFVPLPPMGHMAAMPKRRGPDRQPRKRRAC